MAELHKLAQLSQLQQTPRLPVKIGQTEIALFLVDGEVLATAGRCPHASGPLHKGQVCQTKVSCPWHGWTWDLKTGECEESDDLKLQCFEVSVQGDDVYVSI